MQLEFVGQLLDDSYQKEFQSHIGAIRMIDFLMEGEKRMKFQSHIGAIRIREGARMQDG